MSEPKKTLIVRFRSKPYILSLSEDIDSSFPIKDTGFKVYKDEEEIEKSIICENCGKLNELTPSETSHVINDNCIVCSFCVDECPTIPNSISLGTTIYEIDGDTCVNCGACANVCPVGAISYDGEYSLCTFCNAELPKIPQYIFRVGDEIEVEFEYEKFGEEFDEGLELVWQKYNPDTETWETFKYIEEISESGSASSSFEFVGKAKNLSYRVYGGEEEIPRRIPVPIE